MVETHVRSYDYVMKTDDDSYVALDDVRRLVNDDYWGKCYRGKPVRDKSSKFFVAKEHWSRDSFPLYALGIGYVLSRDFNRCAVSKLADLEFLSMEDAATGVLAERCGVECSETGWDWWDKITRYPSSREKYRDKEFLTHGLKSANEMTQEHQERLRRTNEKRS